MKKWNSLAMAGIVLLLAFGYSIPSVVMAIEDDGRKSELKSFEIENIELSFQNIDIEEEMRIFPDMLLNSIVMETRELDGRDYKRVEKYTDAFLEMLQPNYTIKFIDFKATYYVLMVSQEDERVYPIWECYGIDDEKREYRFWLDDVSGTVLGFEIPYEIIGVSDSDLYMVVEQIGNYYGYEVYGLMASIYDVYKINSWENAVMLFDEEGNVQNTLYMFKIGERLLFNVYPGSVAVYDGAYSETE